VVAARQPADAIDDAGAARLRRCVRLHRAAIADHVQAARGTRIIADQWSSLRAQRGCGDHALLLDPGDRVRLEDPIPPAPAALGRQALGSSLSRRQPGLEVAAAMRQAPNARLPTSRHQSVSARRR
jgi:hypothetical protein